MESGSMSTCMSYPPIYDKNGVHVNPDGNISSCTVKCITCKKEWSAITQYGKTATSEIIDRQESLS